MARTSRNYGAQIKLDGKDKTPDWGPVLESVVVDVAINQPRSAEISLHQPIFGTNDTAPVTSDLIGKDIKIEGIVDDVGTEVFEGVVVAVGQELADDHSLVLTIHALDNGFKLDGGPQFKTFLNKKPTAVIKDIASNAGLSADVPGGKLGAFDFVQQHVSDREMVDDLASTYGYDWWIEGKKLVVKDRTTGGGSLSLDEDDVIRLSARFDGSHTEAKAIVRDWDSATQKAVTGKSSYSKRASWTDKPRSPSGKKSSDVVSPNSPALTQAEAAAIAGARNFDAVEQGGWCEVDCVLKPGAKLHDKTTVPARLLPLFGTKGASLRVIGLQHRFEPSAETTTLHLAGVERTDLAQLVLDNREPLAWSQSGPVVGVITNVTDPDKLGRVKVKYPQLSEKNESDWARVLAPRAGKDGGVFVPPALADEVLVLFQSGDVRRPIVIGGLYSKKFPPPAAEPVEQREATYVTSVDGKAKLKLFTGSEAKDKAEALLEIEAAADTTGKLRFYKENGLLELGKGTLKITVADKKSSITIDDKGAITIDSKDGLTLSATKDVTIKGANVKIEGQQKVDVKAGTKATVESSAGTAVKSSAITEIKGSMVKVN